MNEVAKYTDPKMTGHDAAKKFAEEMGRKVGAWDGLSFRLVDGVAWYQITMQGPSWVIVRK